jgi:hypothetical protein
MTIIKICEGGWIMNSGDFERWRIENNEKVETVPLLLADSKNGVKPATPEQVLDILTEWVGRDKAIAFLAKKPSDPDADPERDGKGE